jgi:serine/threonine protein kinase
VNGLELVKKVADGSVVEAMLGRIDRRHVVVQVARPALARDAELLRDAVEAARVGPIHPELISPGKPVKGPDGRLMVISDEVTGWTAADLLRLSGPIAPERVVEWMVGVCEALDALHARGRVHGCLAPRHLHVHGEPDRPAVRLFDTGLLHLRGVHSMPTRACVVEPEYLSPERAAGERGAIASDIWGVGVLVVELLRGRPPYRGASPAETRAAVKEPAPIPVSFFGVWRDVLRGCLAPAPMDRFASAIELRQAIASLA